MVVFIIENIVQSIDGLFCNICDGIFWCFRFIELLAHLFSFIHQLLTLFLDLNRAIFACVFSSIKSTIDHGKWIKSVFVSCIEYIHSGMVETVTSTVHFPHQLLTKTNESFYTMMRFDYQYYWNQLQFGFKEFVLECLEFIGKYCILFTKVMAGVSKVLFDLCNDVVRNVVLFLEKHVDILGKWFIDILILKPLYILASIGDLMFDFVSKSWRTITDSFGLLVLKVSNFCTCLYEIVFPAGVYTSEVISLPFALTKEILGYISGSSKLAVSICILFILCVLVSVFSSNWFYSFVRFLIHGRNIRRQNAYFEQNQPPPRRQNVHFEQNQPPPPPPPPSKTTKTNVSDEMKTGELPVCVICQDTNRTVLILPCKHLCVCTTCFRRLLDMRAYMRNCPLCRTPIEGHINVYL